MSSEAFSSAGWSGYFEITSDNLLVDEAVGNVYYDLASAPASFWSAVKSDGGDIRVTNSAGDTAYSYEVAGFNSASSIGSLFFDSSLLSTGSNVTWRIYAGNSGASLPAVTDTLGARNVYDANYVGVWHLDEDPSGSAPQMVNSNGADHNLTSAGTMTSGDSVTGLVDRAIEFDGSDDRFTAPDHADLDITGNMTIELIFKRSGISSAQHLVSKGTNSFVFYFPSGLDNRLWFGRLGVVDICRSSGTITDTTDWHYAAATRESDGSGNIYVDGADDTVDLSTATFTANTTALNVGQASAGNNRFEGLMDELRISNVARSANYHSTHDALYRTNSTFWTTGAWVLVAVNRNLLLLGVGT